MYFFFNIFVLFCYIIIHIWIEYFIKNWILSTVFYHNFITKLPWKKLSDSALKQSNIAQNAGNATLIVKNFRGSMPPHPPSQPANPPNWPAGLKLIENTDLLRIPVHCERITLKVCVYPPISEFNITTIRLAFILITLS